LHDLIDLAVLLARDELPMLVGELNLEANFVVECLLFVQRKRLGKILGNK